MTTYKVVRVENHSYFVNFQSINHDGLLNDLFSITVYPIRSWAILNVIFQAKNKQTPHQSYDRGPLIEHALLKQRKGIQTQQFNPVSALILTTDSVLFCCGRPHVSLNEGISGSQKVEMCGSYSGKQYLDIPPWLSLQVSKLYDVYFISRCLMPE